MSTIPYPPDFDIDYHAAWHEERRRRALNALDIGDVLAEVDALIAGEPDPERHPLYSLVANALDRRVMAGTPEGLQTRATAGSSIRPSSAWSTRPWPGGRTRASGREREIRCNKGTQHS
jgi:hypothetical protein